MFAVGTVGFHYARNAVVRSADAAVVVGSTNEANDGDDVRGFSKRKTNGG